MCHTTFHPSLTCHNVCHKMPTCIGQLLLQVHKTFHFKCVAHSSCKITKLLKQIQCVIQFLIQVQHVSHTFSCKSDMQYTTPRNPTSVSRLLLHVPQTFFNTPNVCHPSHANSQKCFMQLHHVSYYPWKSNGNVKRKTNIPVMLWWTCYQAAHEDSKLTRKFFITCLKACCMKTSWRLVVNWTLKETMGRQHQRVDWPWIYYFGKPRTTRSGGSWL